MRLRSLLGICVAYIMFTVLTWGGLLLSPCVRWTRLLIIVLALRPLLLVFGISLADLFENPTISVGMVGWFVWGAMDLARTVEYAIQAGWSLIVPYIRLFR